MIITAHLRKECNFTDIFCGVIKEVAGIRKDDDPRTLLSNDLTSRLGIPSASHDIPENFLSADAIHNLTFN